MTRFRYFVLGLTVLGLIALAVSGFQKSSRPTSKPFTLVSAIYQTEKDGQQVLMSISTKFVRNSEFWKEVVVKKQTQEVHQTIAKGGSIYEVVNGKLEWLSNTAPYEEPVVPPTEYYAQYTRTENLFGLTTYVTHMDMGTDGYEEEWHALEMGAIPLKTHLSLHGGKSQMTTEPLALTFGDIPDSILEGPDLPISFDRINILLKAAEKAGQHEYVDQTRATIEEEKKKQQR